MTFSAGVTGSAPFSYQWNSNNVAVPGATNATLTLTNVNLSASGSYSVLVTNSYGRALSGNALLAVLPILVTTQPASGFSATGAVLNGSVTVGPDETVAWFEWGTDTNYGNIAGVTTVPGNDGSNSISAPLSGLPGNYYHYRLDAANDFGIVYGKDQLFTVGFAPSATTLPPTNGANGATFNAVVNPEGWDTTVYFQWGTTNFANSTPGTDIGAGTTSLNVSSFVPGLSASVPYKYQVVARNALGTAVGQVVFGDPDQHHYFFSGSLTNITLPPGTYIITAYGAPGGWAYNPAYYGFAAPGFGAEMSAEFNFATSTTLTLLVGGGGGGARGRRFDYDSTNYSGGGGGGGSFVVEGSTPLVIAGGGGGGAVSGLHNPLFVDGGNGRTYTYGDAGAASPMSVLTICSANPPLAALVAPAGAAVGAAVASTAAAVGAVAASTAAAVMVMVLAAAGAVPVLKTAAAAALPAPMATTLAATIAAASVAGVPAIATSAIATTNSVSVAGVVAIAAAGWRRCQRLRIRHERHHRNDRQRRRRRLNH